MNIGCIVMASGDAVRFGSNKLLYPLKGRPMITHLLDNLPCELNPIVVTRTPNVARLCDERGISVLLHDLPDVSDTIRIGTERMLARDGCMYCVADQPLLSRATLLRLADAFYAAPECIVRACWGERRGNPVVFPRVLFRELMALGKGQTGSAVIKRHTELIRLVGVADERELFDVDTLAQLNELECDGGRMVSAPT